uniref:Male-enhanced antigen 1 n=1 Tax=Culex pipiens TaxID=7175 RepID=A0A8D8GXE5_CULPI
MGLPDLPEQTENEENFCMEQDNIINLEITSEDSDNESTEENEYMGYQPLSIHDLNEDSHDESRVNEMTVDRSERSISSNVLYNNQEFLNLDVWNTPRPEALSIEIDQSKVAQIKDVMANFKLPVTSVPDWAIGVPEEQWKEDLLERIRQRQKPDIQNDEENSTASVDKQC